MAVLLIAGETEHPLVIEMKKYLLQFGYYRRSTVASIESEFFDPSAEEALHRYQIRRGLPVGDFDDNSLLSMILPRCGNPDIFVAEDGSVRPYREVPIDLSERPANAEGKRTVTFRIGTFPAPIGLLDIPLAIVSALNKWGGVLNIIFAEAGSSRPDFDFSWQPNNHSDGTPFAQCSLAKVIAHSFYPSDPSWKGHCHFNETCRFGAAATALAQPRTYNFHAVALHEIGHLLGLTHGSNRVEIMHEDAKNTATLAANDLTRIRTLYGMP